MIKTYTLNGKTAKCARCGSEIKKVIEIDGITFGLKCGIVHLGIIPRQNLARQAAGLAYESTKPPQARAYFVNLVHAEMGARGADWGHWDRDAALVTLGECIAAQLGIHPAGPETDRRFLADLVYQTLTLQTTL